MRAYSRIALWTATIVFVMHSMYWLLVSTKCNDSTKACGVLHVFARNVTDSGPINPTEGLVSLSPTLSTTPTSSISPSCHVFFGVLSEAANWETRQAIRDTWLKSNEFRLLGAQHRFFVGQGANDWTPEMKSEQEQYGDIIQLPHVDTYQNLTIKVTLLVKWPSAHGLKCTFIVKVDDDIYIHSGSFARLLKELPSSRVYGGLPVRDGLVVRNPESKWYLSPAAYPRGNFPPYAAGPLYFMSSDVADALPYEVDFDNVWGNSSVTSQSSYKQFYQNHHEEGLWKLEDVFIGSLIDQLPFLVHRPGNNTFLQNWFGSSCVSTAYAEHRVEPPIMRELHAEPHRLCELYALASVSKTIGYQQNDYVKSPWYLIYMEELDLQSRTPYIQQPPARNNRDKYLLLQLPGGFNNQRLSIMEGMAYAYILGRTLVLPKLYSTQDNFYAEPVTYLDLNLLNSLVPVIPLNTMLEARPQINVDRYYTLNHNRSGWWRSHSVYFQNVYSDRIRLPKMFTIDIDHPLNETEILDRFRGTDDMEVLAIESLFGDFRFSSNPGLFHMLSDMFMNSLHTNIWNEYRNFTRIHLTDHSYLATHFRRETFWIQHCERLAPGEYLTHCYPPIEEFVTKMTSILKTMDCRMIFIATDSRDDTELNYLKNHLPVVFYSPTVKTIDSIAQALVVQLILSNAELFIGNQWSTYSGFTMMQRDFLGKPPTTSLYY